MPKAKPIMIWKANSKNSHRIKEKKDPNAPKRYLNAYMFFCVEQRNNVRADFPNITFGQTGRVLGERWKALSESERRPYKIKAEVDKRRYETEKASYASTQDKEDDAT